VQSAVGLLWTRTSGRAPGTTASAQVTRPSRSHLDGCSICRVMNDC
jgi:hypothetical protein